MKKTAVAPSNIAFIKYWGKKNDELRLPENGSISMNLDNLLTTTTVEFNPSFQKDSIIIDGKELTQEEKRIIKHVDRIRKIAHIQDHVKIVSTSNFPAHTGLSSSASGFAALTVAASSAAGLRLSEKELSILARLGSGSSCRSIPNGFTEWLDGNTNDTSYGVSVYPPTYWDIADVVVITSIEKKNTPTTEGQKLFNTSPFYKARLEKMPDKIKRIKKYIEKKDFSSFGELIEEEALELHSIMLTSTPSLIYLLPSTLQIMIEVKKWRQKGLEVYFTLNTGQNIHLICQKKDEKAVVKKVQKLEYVQQVILNHAGNGARIIDTHLF